MLSLLDRLYEAGSLIKTVSERVARQYSSPDMRVHLVGDAA